MNIGWSKLPEEIVAIVTHSDYSGLYYLLKLDGGIYSTNYEEDWEGLGNDSIVSIRDGCEIDLINFLSKFLDKLFEKHNDLYEEVNNLKEN